MAEVNKTLTIAMQALVDSAMAKKKQDAIRANAEEFAGSIGAVPADFGARLRASRKHLGLTIKELADMLDMTSRELIDIEWARVEVTPEIVQTITETIGLPPEIMKIE